MGFRSFLFSFHRDLNCGAGLRGHIWPLNPGAVGLALNPLT